MFQTIPLNQLVSSPRNVRRHGDPTEDAALKASIAAQRPARKDDKTYKDEHGYRSDAFHLVSQGLHHQRTIGCDFVLA